MTEPLLSYQSVRRAIDLAEEIALAGLDVFFTSAPDGATAMAFTATLDEITKAAATTAASMM
jgi:hypothetical protein